MKRLLIPVALLSVAACGLISSDVTKSKLHFASDSFTVDTSSWNLPAGSSVPSVPCTATPDNCPAGASQVCGGSCTAVCGSGGTCQGHVPVTAHEDYDLSKDSGFQQYANQSVLSVEVTALYFQIAQNSLNVATPVLNVYLGPQTITSPSDPAAKLIGTIASIPARQSGRFDVTFAAGGQAVLTESLNDFKTPRRVLVSGDLVITAGQSLPSGQLVGNVQIDVSVGL
jgi:hypothetical protein